MVKKVLALAFGLMMAFGAMADNYPYPASNIQFWTGTGSNSAVVVISWDDEDASYTPQGFAWGVHFNGTISARNLLDTIAAYDSRFTFSFSSTLLSTIAYNDNVNNIHLTPSVQYNCFNMNGTFAPDVYDNITVSNGDMMEVSESCMFDCTNITPATDPNGGSSTDPVDATIDFDDIVYWVGTGSNEAAFIISFAEPDTALAWGFRYNQATIQDMMDSLAAADPRLTIVDNPSYMGDLYFVNAPGDTLRLSPVDPQLGYNFWWTNLNGLSVASYTTALQDGDYFKFGDLNSATGWDLQGGYYMQEAWTTEVHPVSIPGSDPVEPTPEDAEIAASDILYWVGEGNSKVVFAINWADTALAWGYKFSTDSVYVSEIIDAIVAADPRLSIEGTSSFVSDFRYADENIPDTLTITPHAADDYSIYFNMQVNHVSSMVGAAGHAVVNGDFVKFADTYVAVKADSTWIEDWGGYWDYTYVWPMTIHPVSVPDSNEGITIAEGMSVSVYPNPAASAVNVSFSALESAAEVELFDMTGRRVAVYSVAAGCSDIQLSVDGLANGIYMLRIADATAKVVVRK